MPNKRIVGKFINSSERENFLAWCFMFSDAYTAEKSTKQVSAANKRTSTNRSVKKNYPDRKVGKLS